MSNLRPIVTGPVGPQRGQSAAELFQEQFVDAAMQQRRVDQAARGADVGAGTPGDSRVPGAGDRR